MYKHYILTIFTLYFLSAKEMSAQDNSLEKKVTISFNNTSITSVLDKIEAQENVFFSYNKTALKKLPNITHDFIDTPLDKILEHLFLDNKLYYFAKEEVIYIKNKPRSFSITGQIKDSKGVPIPLIAIYITNSIYGASTDEDGFFEFKVPEGKYILKTSALGYQNITKQITLRKNLSLLNLVLKTESHNLKEVVVNGITKAEKQRQLAYAVNIVEAKYYKNTSANVLQIIDRIPGVIIREQGGVGSNSDISLNGLSGKQVRIFIDGIPMRYFGKSLSLNNFPANIIENIEVYKGVVPIHLSSDALGGGINITTSKKYMDYLDVSYEMGSFNTHRMAVNTQYVNKNSGFTARLKSYYNYSDNDYWIDTPVVKNNGVIPNYTTKVKRFHDAYKSRMLQFEVGLMKKKYADELFVGLLTADNYKEKQHSRFYRRILVPFGEAHEKNSSYVSTLKYSKKNILKDLDLRFYGAYINGDVNYVDISDFRYKWDGSVKKEKHFSVGEEGKKTKLNIYIKNLLSNTHLQYHFKNNHILSLNYSTSYSKIMGSDPINAQNNTQFSIPSSFYTNITGLSYSFDALKSKYKNILFVKNYSSRINSIETNFSGDAKNDYNSSENNWGYGLATTRIFGENTQLKFSFEKAIRIPDPYEILGDGVDVVPNIKLRPETSNNINLGVRTTLKTGLQNKLVLESNLFYRDATDAIFLVPELVKGNYENEKNINSSGIESEIQYTYKNRLKIDLSATYMRILNKTGNKTTNPLYNTEIPNIPYLFGNLRIGYQIKNILPKAHKLTISSAARYTHEYFLYSAKLGSNSGKAKIPTQITQELSLNANLHKGKYNISFAIHNLYNTRVTDNYNLQKPGRNFNIKLRYNLIKQK